jgi:hypothetical protein
MSKKADLKTEQGYDPKPTFAMCSNCKNFKSDKIRNQWGYEEKNIRCGLGGFAVKKQGTCKMHETQ